MKLLAPFEISSRLMPAIKIADCTISADAPGYDHNGRLCYVFYFDFADGREIVEKGMKSGVGQSTDAFQQGFCSLLSFLSHAAESSEGKDLFAKDIVEFAEANSDEISMLACELEENKDLITDDE